jgi:hypothetical protein
LGSPADVHTFHAAVSAPDATVVSVYMTIHTEGCPTCVHHSPQKIIIINCIQHQIFKFNSCVPICIFDLAQNWNFAIMQL